jgi:multidrug efflux pump subunit AcrA (membrane-fusion protein)
MKSFPGLLIFPLVLIFMPSCNSGHKETEQETSGPKITVQTASVTEGDINAVISLNGRVVYLKKNAVISSIPGYVKKVYVQYGDLVNKNQLLFDIQTKENKAMEKSGLVTQFSSDKSGIISIFAPSDGIIGELNINAPGVYVVEGTQLCSITENQDMMVQVNVPFEYNQLIRIGQDCKIVLLDNTILDGTISKVIPLVNEASQTQNVLIGIRDNRHLPENLNVIVQFVRSSHSKVMLIPKEALLTNEVQQDFWVMKIIRDSIAVKIHVRKGFENDNRVEVFSPNLSVNDEVITEGAYGLPDSTIVKVLR